MPTVASHAIACRGMWRRKVLVMVRQTLETPRCKARPGSHTLGGQQLLMSDFMGQFTVTIVLNYFILGRVALILIKRNQLETRCNTDLLGEAQGSYHRRCPRQVHGELHP